MQADAAVIVMVAAVLGLLPPLGAQPPVQVTLTPVDSVTRVPAEYMPEHGVVVPGHAKLSAGKLLIARSVVPVFVTVNVYRVGVGVGVAVGVAVADGVGVGVGGTTHVVESHGWMMTAPVRVLVQLVAVLVTVTSTSVGMLTTPSCVPVVQLVVLIATPDRSGSGSVILVGVILDVTGTAVSPPKETVTPEVENPAPLIVTV